MKIIKSFLRVAKKRDAFADMFGYDSDMPRAVLFGPQEESDEYEALLDKSLADKKDYLEIKYGYDADAIRERIEKNRYIFYD